MNILKRELKSNLKVLIIWALVIIAFCIMGFAEGQAFVGEASIQELMDGMPDELMAMFSMDAFDLSTPEGYYGLLATYIALALSIYCVMRASSTVVSEERDKIVEFSLVLPIKRHKLLTAKILVVFLYGVVLNIVAMFCSFAFGLYVNAGSGFNKYVIISSIATLFIQIIFIGIGFLIGCAFRNHKKAGSLAVGILLTTYFFSLFSGIHEKLEFLRYLTPFKFFDFIEILNDMTINLTYVIISLLISGACITAGYIVYNKRDMRI